MTVENGRPWERPASGPPECQVDGDDAALAATVRDRPGARIAFRPSAGSDLARALSLDPSGLEPEGAHTLELPVDALRVDVDGQPRLAVNMVVLGAAPDRLRRLDRAVAITVVVDGRVLRDERALTVVLASGQYLRGLDLVPRGHPGDGRIEVQVYAPRPGERRAMRDRVRRGEHLPHPRIIQVAGRRIEVRSADRALRLEIDGVPAPTARRVVVEVIPEAFCLMA